MLIEVSMPDIYLAATVLLAAQLRPVVTLDAISTAELQRSWNSALKILRHFQSNNVSAKRCVIALSTLYDKIPASQNQALPVQRPATLPDAQPSWSSPIGLGESDDFTAATSKNTIDPTQDQDVAMTFDWLASFDDVDVSDLSWLTTMPHEFFA